MDENLTRGYVQLGQANRSDLINSRHHGGAHPKPPEDRCHCIYFALMLAGIGFLLPYNSFIIAVDYYQHRYPGTTIVFDMSLVYILMAFVAVVINNLLVETLSLHVRITFGYILSFFTLLFVALCVIWFHVFDEKTSYSINLIAVAVVALGCTVQQSSFYGYTSMLPPRYTQAVMTGESAAGLLISTNRILTKALMDNEKANTITFFVISISIVWMCFVIHFVVQKTEFIQFYINFCAAGGEEDDLHRIVLEPSEEVGLVDILDVAESRNKYGVLTLHSPTGEAPDSAFQSSENIQQNLETGRPSEGPGTTGTTYKVQDVVIRMRGTYSNAYTSGIRMWGGIKSVEDSDLFVFWNLPIFIAGRLLVPPQSRGVLARWHVARTVWPYMLSIALAYFVTLCLFPGIESEVVSCSMSSWMPVILMAVFNLFDFIGKILASIPYEWTRLQLLLCSLMRIFLVPLLVMCAAPRENPLIPGEGWAMVFSLVLGVTNGVFGSVPMIMAPSKVPDEHRELTGNIMTLSYSIGLTTGSGVAYLLDEILGPPLVDPCAARNHLLQTTAMTFMNSTAAVLENITSAIT